MSDSRGGGQKGHGKQNIAMSDSRGGGQKGHGKSSLHKGTHTGKKGGHDSPAKFTSPEYS
jgi:hypothetical protein